MRAEKLVDFFESLSAFERDDEPWLAGVAAATREVWGSPAATFSVFYDASDPRDFCVKLVVTDGISAEVRAAMFQSLGLLTPDLVVRVFRQALAGPLRRVTPELNPALAAARPFGVADSFGFCASEPDGLGCSITLHTAARHEVARDDLELYARMALHLGAALRCRRRLRAQSNLRGRIDPTAGAEAILDAAGKVIHAEGLARNRPAQERLKEARRRFDQVRVRKGSTKSSDRITAVNHHRPLVDARWTLVEAHEPGGARYVVARENQAAVGGLEHLTDRERQVAVLLALGRTSKEIAYALGISDSTTRVLLGRAKARIGARTRDELISIVTRHALPGL